MKNKKINSGRNKILIIVMIILAVLLVGFIILIGVHNYMNRGKTFVDGLIITDVEIKKEGKFYDFTATVTADETKTVKSIDVIFYDKNNNKIIKVNNIVNRNLKKNDEFKINAKTDLNIEEAEKIEYKVN